jgi:hypothetical protein
MVLFFLIAFELFTAFITLSKLDVLKVIIVLVLAWILRGVNYKRLIATGALILVSYALILSPLIRYGRMAFNTNGLQSLSEVTALTNDFGSGYARDKIDRTFPGVQGWWARLNYANAQAFAMDEFDHKREGDTFVLAVWTFVPRMFFPEKPITTTGDKFNKLVTGNPNSQSSPGMFAEGYWNAGWFGLIIVFILMGIFYAVWEKYTVRNLNIMRLQFLPVMWMGLFPAIQQDCWFIPYSIGLLPIAIVFHLLLSIIFSRNSEQPRVFGRPLFVNRVE